MRLPRPRRNVRRGAVGAALGALLALASPAAVAESAAEAGDADAAELEALLAVLAEETDVATRTRMNADYVPGIVSVLDGEELEALGARNVAEALALVPGVVVDRDEAGSPILRVRGVDFFFNSGNVKVLIDGLVLSRETAGINGSVLLLPIEQVERIEMIRGPGSGLYGDFAFNGLVNVVTRRRAAVFAAGGTGDLRAGGAAWHRADPGDGWRAAVTASTWQSDRGDAPNDVAADEERSFASGSFGKGGFSLTTTALRREQHAPGTGFPGVDERSAAVEARQTWSLGAGRELAAWTRYLDNTIEFALLRFAGDRLTGGLDLDWRTDRHRWLVQASYARSTIEEASQRPPPGSPVFPVELRDLDRDVFSLAVQDQLELGSRVTVTGGVRWDHFSDIGDVFTPRLAAVLRLADRHTLKAQVAEGYRAPIFFELYAGGGLNHEVDPEEIRTWELGYVYRRPASVARATLFRSDVDGFLVPVGGSRFGNRGEATADGVELEWSQELGRRLKVVAGLTLLDTDDTRGYPPGEPGDSTAAADRLADLALLWRPFDPVLVGLRWDHVGDRAVPRREPVDGYDQLDLTVTLRPRRPSGLQLRLGVRNLLDEPVSTPIQRPNALRVLRYDERTVTVAAAWSFR